MAAGSRSHCLDSWAVLRFLEGLAGAARRVRQVMPLAYGDAFAIATAAAHGAVLLTGYPEIVGRSVGCKVEDLRD